MTNRLKELRRKHGYTQEEMGKKMGVTQNAYSYWERGKVKIDHASLMRMAEFFGVSVDYLLGREIQYGDNAAPAPTRPGSKWVPVLGRVAAGFPIEAIEDILDYEEISPQMAQNGEYFALQIKGDSMEPLMKNGDIVIVLRQSDAENGETAVVLVNGDEATVKRIKKSPDGLMLIANNPAYDPMFYSAAQVERLPVVILGKVVELRRKF